MFDRDPTVINKFTHVWRVQYGPWSGGVPAGQVFISVCSVSGAKIYAARLGYDRHFIATRVARDDVSAHEIIYEAEFPVETFQGGAICLMNL